MLDVGQMIEAWTRFCYPRRRTVFFGGCLFFLFWIFAEAVRAGVYVAGLAVIAVIGFFSLIIWLCMGMPKD